MRIYSYGEFSWEDNALHLNGIDLGFELVPFWVDGIEFFKIVWPDGALSENYCNLTRTKDSLIKHCMTALNTHGVIPHLG